MVIALVVLLVLSSIGIIALILLQSGRSAGLSGAVAGAGESVFGKKKGLDELLAKITGVFAGIFLLASLALTILYK